MKLKDKITESIVFGGAAGGGKSFLGCEWLFTSCLFYPDTKYFIGRENLKDLRESTVQTWYKMLKFHGINGDNIHKFNGQDNFFQFFNGSRVDLVELKKYPSDPMYERFGSKEYTSGWIEEAGESDSDAVNIISSRVGRWNNAKYDLLGKVLLTCNPKKNFLYYDYYRPFTEGILSPNKAFIKSLVDDNNFGEPGYKKKLEALGGAARERLLLGNWEYDDDPNTLIEYAAILSCFTNDFIPPGDTHITCDVARFGKDSTVIGIWHGMRVKLYRYHGKSVTEVSDLIKNFCSQFSVPMSRVIVDEDGVGGGCKDILGCAGFVNNSRALPNPLSGVDENFDNLKSQCYFTLAERINKNCIFISCNPSDKQTVIEELEQVKQKNIDDDKKRGVIPKDKVKEVLGRSPDFADTLMMRMWFELSPKMYWSRAKAT